jgi:hypothetical protein
MPYTLEEKAQFVLSGLLMLISLVMIVDAIINS